MGRRKMITTESQCLDCFPTFCQNEQTESKEEENWRRTDKQTQ